MSPVEECWDIYLHYKRSFTEITRG